MIKETLDLANNPLVNPPKQPFDALPLGSAKPEHFRPAIDHYLAEARENIAAIIADTAPATFENTIQALSEANSGLGKTMEVFDVLSSSVNTESLQAVSKDIRPLLTDFITEVNLNKALFARIKAVYDQGTQGLSEEQGILLEKIYQRFKNSGALLTGEKEQQYKELSRKLSNLSNQYKENLDNHNAALKIVIPPQDGHRLDGIPEGIINAYRQNAIDDPDVSDDSWVITMTPPPAFVLTYARDRSLREEARAMQIKVGSEDAFDNTEIVRDILKTRHEIAQILGFNNHAERTIRPDTRMAETPDAVMKFLKANAKAYLPVTKKFYEELADFARRKDGLEEIKGQDRLYYINLMREAQIGFDAKEALPYFEMENVLKGMFAHAEKLYGVKVQEVKGKYETHHQDVRTYEILDGESGEVKALYYLDPFARKYKQGGASMHGLRQAGIYDGERKIPVAINFCNIVEAKKGEPTLLTDDDVTTLFHEFGHGLHCMMEDGNLPELGMATPWDYVELPSQINECWAMKPEVLATYARHHETGDVIPQRIVDGLQGLAAYLMRWQGIRQTELGLIDMALHTTPPEDIGDLLAFQNKVWKDTEITPWNAPPMILNFSHIMSGAYSAGYYSYKWADALVADVFEQFEDKGLYDPSLCRAFRDCMIAPGGRRHASDMFKDFMEAAGQGRRDIDPEAMFRAEGILPPKKTATPPPRP